MSDNGGVHTNSGIPNKAFADLALGARRPRLGEGRADLVRDAPGSAHAPQRDLPAVRRANRCDGRRLYGTGSDEVNAVLACWERRRRQRRVMAGQPERIELERTGGFANIPLRASVPVSALIRRRASRHRRAARAPAGRSTGGRRPGPLPIRPHDHRGRPATPRAHRGASGRRSVACTRRPDGTRGHARKSASRVIARLGVRAARVVDQRCTGRLGAGSALAGRVSTAAPMRARRAGSSTSRSVFTQSRRSVSWRSAERTSTGQSSQL